MKRISTDAEYLDNGKVVIDADGIPIEPAAKSDLATKADKTYVDETKWVQSQLAASTDFDTVRDPSVRIMLGGTHESAPFNAIGVLEVLPTAYGGTIQRATNRTSLAVYQRCTVSGVFQEWVKQPSKADLDSLQALIPTDASIQAKIDDAISGNAGTFNSDWTRRVPLAVTTGAGPSEGPGAGTYRIRTQFTAPITRWRLHVSTRYPIYPTIRDGANIQNVSIGENLGDGNIGAAIELASSADIDAGDEWVSAWQTYNLSQDSLISMDVTPDGSHYNLLAPAWKDGVQVNRAPLWVWIEAETYTDTPTVALIGDSTGAGHGSIEPVWDSAVAIAGRKQEFLPVLFASSGDTLSGNVSIDDPNFERWSGYGTYDSVVIQAGSNDINTGKTLAEVQASFIAVADVAKELGAKIYGATIKPRYPTDPNTEVREAYNDWLKTLPAGIAGVLDYSTAVAPDGAILPEDNDDGAHLKSSGHHKLAAAYSFPVARPRVVGTWKP